MSKSRSIVDAVLKDLLGRGGFDGTWDGIDEDLQEEIKDDLTEVVQKELEK